MKKYFFAMLTMAAALCGCSEDELLTNEVPQPGGGETNEVVEPMVFTATMEGAPETRATYDGTNKCASWEEGDRISVNNIIHQAITAGTSTTFSPIVDAEEIRPTFVSSTNTGSYQNKYPTQNLVDEGGVDTRWIANKTDMVDGVWNIVVTTGKTTQLKSIKLWNHDNATNPGRRWKSMKLYGSTSSDGEWAEIQSFSNLNLAINNRALAGEIVVNATEGYTHYRIDVLDNEGDKDGWMQMSDMKFVVNPAANAPYDAYFPASLYDGTTAVLPTNITETWADGKFNMPMYAHSENTELQFKNLCGVLKIIVKSDQIAAVKKIRVSSANKATSGEFTVNSDNAAVLVNPNAVDNTVTTVYNTAVPTTAEGTTFYVALPAQTYQELKIDLSSDVTFTKSMTTKSATDITVVRNTIYPIIFVNSKPLPAGALPGVFTVDYDDKKVYFSRGNLYYDGSKFNFEANQYGFNSSYQSTYVSHFYWSKDERVAYSDDYDTANSTYGITPDQKDVFFTNADGFKVNVGGKDQTGWRTLSTEEWQYLFENHSNKWATVNGVGGYVIAPDNVTLQAEKTSYTATELNDAKLVFLPAAGNRSFFNVVDVGVSGCYWSSTVIQGDDVYRVGFNSDDVLPGRSDDRHSGCSVRLITEVE